MNYSTSRRIPNGAKGGHGHDCRDHADIEATADPRRVLRSLVFSDAALMSIRPNNVPVSVIWPSPLAAEVLGDRAQRSELPG